MIEAVNSVVANAPLLRGNTEQTSSARSNTSGVQGAAPATTAPQAPFISPFIFMDVNFDTAVLQIRDPQTGAVVEQIPSRSRLESQQRSQAGTIAAQEVQQSQQTQQAVQESASVQAQATQQVQSAQAQAVSQAFAASAQAAESVVSSSVSVFA